MSLTYACKDGDHGRECGGVAHEGLHCLTPGFPCNCPPCTCHCHGVDGYDVAILAGVM